jgi:hypothetical protein
MPFARLAVLSDGPGGDLVDEPPLADPDVVVYGLETSHIAGKGSGGVNPRSRSPNPDWPPASKLPSRAIVKVP